MTQWNGKERRGENKAPLEEVVSLAVVQTLTSLGFDMKDPINVQKDVQHLRKSRQICDSIQTNAVRVGVTSIGGGIFWAIWQGIKEGVK